MTFIKPGSPRQVYCVGICLIFSHDQTGAMGFQEQDHRGKKSAIFITDHLKGTFY